MQTVEEKKEKARLRTRQWHARHPRSYKKAAPRFLKCLNENCGLIFEAKTSGKYCTRSCRNKHYRKTNPELFRAMWARNRDKANAHCMENYRKTRARTPWKILLEAAKVRSRKRRIPCTVDDAWCRARWTGHCELTNLPFSVGASRREAMSPSLDQIIAGKGYTPENARFVLWGINTAKGTDSDETLYKIAAALMTNISRSD